MFDFTEYIVIRQFMQYVLLNKTYLDQWWRWYGGYYSVHFVIQELVFKKQMLGLYASVHSGEKQKACLKLRVMIEPLAPPV